MSPRSLALALAMLVLTAFVASPDVHAEEQPLYNELPDERVLYVAPGQSLGELVREAYPGQSDRWTEIRQWIVDNNAHAFIAGDPDRLRGDVRLQLPSASEFARRQTPAPSEAAGFELVFDGRFLFVNPSQSLAELVPRIYPNHSGRWDAITEAIVERNRELMGDRDTDRRIARGTRLVIPNVVAAIEQPEREPEPVVGEVMDAVGSVHATDSVGRRRALAAGAPIHRGDMVSTGADSSVRIEFRDGEELLVRAASSVRVREWSLPDVGPGQRVIGLLEGGLRAITGALGNRVQDDYRTVTPAATMGIRGTDYSLQLCAPNACTSPAGGTLDAGLYAAVASGEIELLNAGGEAVYSAGEYGYVADSGVAPVHIDGGEAPVAVTGDRESDEDGSAWWIAVGLLLLLAL